MRKKSITALLLALLLSVTLALGACKKDESGGGNGGETEPPEENYTYVDKSSLAYVDSLDSYKKIDWTANWIWDEFSAPDSYVAFRKTFTLDATPTSAKAFISAESKYFMWVNGELAVYDGSVKRGPTRFDAYYDEIALTNLKKGDNTLAFLVAYNGRNSDSSLDPGQGGLLFEAEIDAKKVVSDTSFKFKRLRAYKNKSLLGGSYPNYKQSAMLGEWNIYYDARESVGDFTAPGFDDSAWDNAKKVGKPGAEPFNDLYLNNAPAIAFDGIVDYENSTTYVNQTFDKDTTITLNLSLNRQFSPYFELTADAGKKIIYYTDTYEVGKGTQEFNFKDTYVTAKGSQKYENYPWRSGSQLIVEVPAGVQFTRLGFRPSGYATEATGNFECADESLNTLWQKSLNTLLITMRDTFMDCPDRERAPYMGDATNEVDMVFYALDTDSYALVKKAILAEIGWTEMTHLIPSRVPSIKPHEIPAQSLAFITAAYNYYLYTGDVQTMQLFYPVAINYLKVWSLKSNGLLDTRAGSWSWTDWGTGVDVEVLQNCWYYYAADCLEKLASELNITVDNAFLTERKTSIKNNFANEFKSGIGFKSTTDFDDRANALAVVCGLAAPSDYDGITQILKTVNRASPFMEKYVLQSLCMMGAYDAAISRMKDRYGSMITDKCTTLWELWEKDAGSVNHGWSGGPMVILSKYFAGIRPTKAGYAEYEICLQDTLGDLRTDVDTVKGKIALSLVGKTLTVTTVDGVCMLKVPIQMGPPKSVTGGAFTDIGEVNGCQVYKLTQSATYTVQLS